MGAVYQALDIELNRTIALKVIRPDLAGNQAIIDRFKQELILATQVTHKNVVRIYDLGESRRHEVHHHGIRRGPGPALADP